jgi:hypothetical protein
MAVPILGQADEPLGVLIVHSLEQYRFSGDDTSFLEVIAHVLAAAIERERSRDHIERLAYRDELTGLPNRARLQERLDELAELADRHARAVGLVWVDVDHFQIVNDSFGQRTGDEVIRQIAGGWRRREPPPSWLPATSVTSSCWWSQTARPIPSASPAATPRTSPRSPRRWQDGCAVRLRDAVRRAGLRGAPRRPGQGSGQGGAANRRRSHRQERAGAAR